MNVVPAPRPHLRSSPSPEAIEPTHPPPPPTTTTSDLNHPVVSPICARTRSTTNTSTRTNPAHISNHQ